MQTAYGEGYLSPGGAEETADLVEGICLQDRKLLDLGCGVGGASRALASESGARVIGVDVEEGALRLAAATVRQVGLTDNMAFVLAEPGPLPVVDEGVDVVFSKDVICHAPDKARFFGEIFRVLRPGGVVTCGDWIKGGEGSRTSDFDDWEAHLDAFGMRFSFETLEVYLRALEGAGFTRIDARDHSAWSARSAQTQLDGYTGPLQAGLTKALGEVGFRSRVRLTRSRMKALRSGGLGHWHLRAQKPSPGKRPV